MIQHANELDRRSLSVTRCLELTTNFLSGERIFHTPKGYLQRTPGLGCNSSSGPALPEDLCSLTALSTQLPVWLQVLGYGPIPNRGGRLEASFIISPEPTSWNATGSVKAFLHSSGVEWHSVPFWISSLWTEVPLMVSAKLKTS